MACFFAALAFLAAVGLCVGLETGEKVEAVGVDPGDGIGDAVDGGVVLGAGEGGGVLLDADDAVPLLGEGEGDGVTAGAGEEVDDDALAGGRGGVGGDVFGDLARGG